MESAGFWLSWFVVTQFCDVSDMFKHVDEGSNRIKQPLLYPVFYVLSMAEVMNNIIQCA